jgi:hypothetical protein
MYRLLENIRPDRKRAGTRQEQPPKKRETGREAWRRRGGTTTGRNCWEASDQRRDTKRHSKKWRFVRPGVEIIQRIRITQYYARTRM